MSTRRSFLAALAASAIVSIAGPARAAPPLVEIVALSHSPVRDALKSVRDFLAKLDGRVRVVEVNVESAEGEKRVRSAGLRGHVAILLLINGDYRFKRPDGKVIEFKDFPGGAENPLGLYGTWTAADFEAAVGAALGEQPKQP